jgi:hypothetical protein
MEIEIVKANKYHTDTGYKYSAPDTKKKSFVLRNTKGFFRHFPKSECKIFVLEQGNVEIHIPKWLYDKEEDFWV